jgi:hypothetical protein
MEISEEQYARLYGEARSEFSLPAETKQEAVGPFFGSVMSRLAAT